MSYVYSEPFPFFDLLPNESIEIEIKKQTGQDLLSFNKSFKIMTLDQTY